MEGTKIRVLVVDDHFMVRMGLASSVNTEPDLLVVAEASNGSQALDAYRKHRPDVTLMDLRLPDRSGIEVTLELCAEFPAARIIVLSTYDGDEDIYRALQAGAWAYLLKSVLREQLLEAIRAVAHGHRYLPPEVAARLAERMPRSDLSARELEVLRLIVKGRSNKEIAAGLFIAEVTVKLHVSHLLSKLRVQDRTQLATEAIRRGIIYL